MGLPFSRPKAWLAEQPRAHCTGTEYEARLRQQHAKLNPRTGWATSAGAHRRRRRGFGGDSDSDEECAAAFRCMMLQSLHMGCMCVTSTALPQTAVCPDFDGHLAILAISSASMQAS